ncbi:MAG: pyruvate formate lyase family protein [Pseudomonadales bacterium]|jgi:formate C-acetyltransferase|nr:pyruvate formate lyase family protein [Pseudomonadales bacterium]MDP7313765.1 pyruvate formate lyase family protein [Pseudomonadales bacterium]|tara:strand:- start:8932 stop:11286 length:2355 start_codon:yes stop_codon:yes gene_type:complete
MSQALQVEPTLREEVITTEATARVEGLRQLYLNTKDRVVIDILRIRTRVMQETEGQPMITRQAKAFAAIVREMPVNIYADEPFVGWLFCEPRGANLSGGQAISIQGEFDTISTREITPFLISDEDKRELREEIIPYWKAHRVAGSTLPHWTAGYEKVLKIGLLGIKKEAEERLASLDLADPEDFSKLAFLEGVVLALEAAAEIGERFAAKARELASTEKDGSRKEELLRIAETCDRVPAHPATTFCEAIQSVWFVHILHALDNEHATGMGPGRPDQYLYPFYKKDIDEGRLDKEQAQELIDCWFMRYSQYYMVWRADAGSYGTHTPHTPGHHLDVGGVKPDGTDASNELSYMFIEAMMHTPGMTEPTLGLLVHSKTPEDLLIKACKLTALGGGYPMFINQDLRIESLLARNEILDGPPITLAIARTGTGAGCHELVVPDMESGFSFTPLNLASVVQLVLTNGISRNSGKKKGIETGDPRQFTSYEEVQEAFCKQMAWQLRNGIIGSHMAERALLPKAFNSALVDDCIEKGISKEEGGARYNIHGVQTWGRIDAGNSMAAIKKLVFDSGKITMNQLCDALEANFVGHEYINKICVDAPKFGNDDDFVDEQIAWVTHVVNEEAKQYKSSYGGCSVVAEVPSASYIGAGKGVAALPSGRLAGEPLCEAGTPTAGSALNGPTSVLKSVGKVNNAEVNQGQTLNLRLEPSLFSREMGFHTLAGLIRVFVDQKVDHVQINVVHSDVLKAAQKEPENYKDLTVKVAGYNARFVELHRELQDSIIARTEYGL